MPVLHPADWVTLHYAWDEMRCNDGTPVPDKYRANAIELCRRLEWIRARWGRPVTILSGYRTPAWNKKVGGAKNSEHLRAAAADIVVAGVEAGEVYDAIHWMIHAGKLADGGLGRYEQWTHVDIGPARRWRG